MVNANAQVLTSSTKYINGSCRDNATYWACNNLGLSAGTDIRARKAPDNFFSIARLLCYHSQSTRGLLLTMRTGLLIVGSLVRLSADVINSLR